VVHCRETKLADILYTEGERLMEIVEQLAQQAAETINGGEFYEGKWFTEGQRQAWRKAMTPAADEIERLREQSRMNWDAFQKAATEIKRLRKALQLIAAPSKVIVKGEEAVVALRLLLSAHRRTALKALGEK
jgi:hypothetical protein